MWRPLAVALIGLVLALTVGSASAGSDSNLQAARAFVRAKGCGAPDTSMWMHGSTFNALFGNCRAGDGHNQRVWFFAGRRFIRTDARRSSKEVIGVWRDGDTIAFLYVLYRRDDSNCCPTGGGRIVRFRWNGSHVVVLDRLPRRQDGSIALGR